MSFFENTRKPVGFGGKIMVAMMNLGHSAVARWGLQFLNTAPDAKVLDCGCGGGANIRRLLKKCPQGVVKGIDYSPVSVEKSKKVNDVAIAEGRCAVLQGSVADMMFTDNWFDAVTAFETVYFWPDLPRCFREVYRVLKVGGTFLICNEANGDTDKDERWTEIIGGMTIYKDTELKAYPIVSPQAEDFDKNEYVEIIPSTGEMSYEKLFCESSLMVTDYSGVQFDFAYLRKPLIYHHHRDLEASCQPILNSISLNIFFPEYMLHIPQ